MPDSRARPAAAAPPHPVAAIVHVPGEAADGLLAGFACDLRNGGVRVHGVVQESGGSKSTTVLVDLETGERFRLFQDLGAGSVSCSLDASAVAAASAALRRALAARPALVVANRFGALEAEGSGFAAEMLALMSERIPLLTLVATPHLDAWRRFTGGAGAELPPRADALRAWFAALQRTREGS